MDVRFGTYRLRRRERALEGPEGPMDLSARSFDILTVLLDKPGEVVAKQQLFDAVWPSVVVEENTLQVHISALRKALGDGMIVTVHGRGYKYAGPPPEPALEDANQHSPLPPAAARSRKPVIAVMPFENHSGDPEQEYFSDGITDELITELGRFSELRVIARNSAFVFKGRPLGAKAIGEQLSADYLLQGSVRRAGSRVRILAQLVDAATEQQLWADRFDREFTGIFELQDEIARNVSMIAAGTMTTAAIEKIRRLPVTELGAYELFLKARITMSHADTILDAEPYLRRAIELDPDVAVFNAMMASVLVVKWFHEIDPETLQRGLDHARRALTLGPREAWSHMAVGHVQIFMERLDEALVHLDDAVALNPNDTWVRTVRAICKNYMGQHEKALAEIDFCVASDPLAHTWFWDIRGSILWALGRYQEAIDSFLKLNVMTYWGHANLAACRHKLGDAEGAASAVRDCLAARPGTTVEDLLAGEFYRDAAKLQALRTDLIAAGIPAATTER